MNFQVFNEGLAPKPSDDDTKLFLFIGGTSESGKSMFGEYMLRSNAANRVKYLRIASELGNKASGNSDPFHYLDPENPDSAERTVELWERLGEIVDGKNRITVIESLKHPHLVRDFGKTTLNAVLITIFIDADLNKRVAREATRTGRPASELLIETTEKDEMKDSFGGLNQIFELSDIQILNNGSKQEYENWLRNFSGEVSAIYPNSSEAETIEYK